MARRQDRSKVVSPLAASRGLERDVASRDGDEAVPFHILVGDDVSYLSAEALEPSPVAELCRPTHPVRPRSDIDTDLMDAVGKRVGRLGRLRCWDGCRIRSRRRLGRLSRRGQCCRPPGRQLYRDRWGADGRCSGSCGRARRERRRSRRGRQRGHRGHRSAVVDTHTAAVDKATTTMLVISRANRDLADFGSPEGTSNERTWPVNVPCGPAGYLLAPRSASTLRCLQRADSCLGR